MNKTEKQLRDQIFLMQEAMDLVDHDSECSGDNADCSCRHMRQIIFCKNLPTIPEDNRVEELLKSWMKSTASSGIDHNDPVFLAFADCVTELQNALK